jgi:hypothetical protein
MISAHFYAGDIDWQEKFIEPLSPIILPEEASPAEGSGIILVWDRGCSAGELYRQAQLLGRQFLGLVKSDKPCELVLLVEP